MDSILEVPFCVFHGGTPARIRAMPRHRETCNQAERMSIGRRCRPLASEIDAVGAQRPTPKYCRRPLIMRRIGFASGEAPQHHKGGIHNEKSAPSATSVDALCIMRKPFEPDEPLDRIEGDPRK
jgi:hypothetical protein